MVAIKDISGDIIASGQHLSVRDLLAELVAKNTDLSDADLSDLDLSGLDLQGARLSGAKLDNADLRQSRLDEAVLRRASLRGTALQGAQLREAILDGAVADGASFAGAGLRHAWMIELRADKARFDDADLSGADMTGAQLYECQFQRAVLEDVRFVDAKVYGNDFREADLRSKEVGLPLEMRPDRGLGSRVVGNKFSSTPHLCSTLRSFKRDTWLGWAANHAAVGAAGGIGGLAALAVIPNLVEAKVGLDLMRSGLSVVTMVSLPLLARTILGGRIRDMVQPHVETLVQGIAKVLDRVAKAGGAATDVVGMFWTGGADALQRAVLATRTKAGAAGWGAAFGRLVLGDVKLVFCDRRHLALALQELSRPRLTGSRGEAETVLVREGATPGGSWPIAMRLHGDGAVTALYPEGSVTWPDQGAPVVVGTLPDGVEVAHDHGYGARSEFEMALFDDHRLEAVGRYWASNHFEAGADGTLLVVDHLKRQVSSLVGPAVLMPDDTREHVVDGRIWTGDVDGRDWPVMDPDAQGGDDPDAEVVQRAPAPVA